MRILVLGAAAGGGFPQWNCNCANCRRARSGDAAAAPQSQSSLAVSADGERWLLLNASPDLRQQILSNPPLHPRGGRRDSPIAAVALTNADVDHVAGLLTLRENQRLSLYAARRVHEALRANPIFDVLAAGVVARYELPLNMPIDVTDSAGGRIGLRVTAFPVPGKVALYLENAAEGAGLGTREGDTIGLEIASGAAHRAVYIPGCARLSSDVAARLENAPLLFFDGTLWHDDELLAGGLAGKTGTRMGHMPIAGPNGSLAAFAAIEIGRKFFVHLNNSNPVLLADSAERAEVERAGWSVARDGMEIAL